MFDLDGPELTAEERELLLHPAAGGVILFDRNLHTPEQIKQLTTEIRDLREPTLLIAVDQEGGRVQRCKVGFSRLPPVSWFGSLYDQDSKQARHITHLIGWLMASELRTVGIDFSFAPVLDLGRPVSSVIGDRAFHERPSVVVELTNSWIQGVREAGMAAVGKHFPGHGGVEEDSHHALPLDDRHPEDIWIDDLLPFRRSIQYGLEAIMPAHVIYTKVAPDPAGFSSYWLQQVLREELGFQGAIFSDDLTMAAAGQAGDYPQRAQAALDAGCDMLLVCNNREGTIKVLEAVADHQNPAAQMRLIRMHGRHFPERTEVHLDPRWQAALDKIAAYEQESPQLPFDV
jgi:beta-N-acetylhexosaminidase